MLEINQCGNNLLSAFNVIILLLGRSTQFGFRASQTTTSSTASGNREHLPSIYRCADADHTGQ